MTIEYLADHPNFVPTLAQWQHDEFGESGGSVRARMARLQRSSERDGIPLTVVALADDELLGSASLVEHDMDTRPELAPWLASVFVAPLHRRRGVGAKLVRRIMAEASRLNISVLYLYTVHSERFYAELGWTLQERTIYREQKVAIMSYRPG